MNLNAKKYDVVCPLSLAPIYWHSMSPSWESSRPLFVLLLNIANPVSLLNVSDTYM